MEGLADLPYRHAAHTMMNPGYTRSETMASDHHAQARILTFAFPPCPSHPSFWVLHSSMQWCVECQTRDWEMFNALYSITQHGQQPSQSSASSRHGTFYYQLPTPPHHVSYTDINPKRLRQQDKKISHTLDVCNSDMIPIYEASTNIS